MKKRQTAGELSNKIAKDSTRYDALELGHAMTEDLERHFMEAVKNYENRIEQDEFCVVMLVAKDNLIQNVIRRKFYCWPFLPKPRPNQVVLLYNKKLGQITKRLWVLPSDMVMSELASLSHVDDRYKTMQAWSISFFKGNFWDHIRKEHDISMLSEHEYFLKHRSELIKSGCDVPDIPVSEEFDFGKIYIKNFIDTKEAMDS